MFWSVFVLKRQCWSPRPVEVSSRDGFTTHYCLREISSAVTALGFKTCHFQTCPATSSPEHWTVVKYLRWQVPRYVTLVSFNMYLINMVPIAQVIFFFPVVQQSWIFWPWTEPIATTLTIYLTLTLFNLNHLAIPLQC